jgi:hypothetical protein
MMDKYENIPKDEIAGAALKNLAWGITQSVLEGIITWAIVNATITAEDTKLQYAGISATLIYGCILVSNIRECVSDFKVMYEHRARD